MAKSQLIGNNYIDKIFFSAYNIETVLGGELAVPCICNPLYAEPNVCLGKLQLNFQMLLPCVEIKVLCNANS